MSPARSFAARSRCRRARALVAGASQAPQPAARCVAPADGSPDAAETQASSASPTAARSGNAPHAPPKPPRPPPRERQTSPPRRAATSHKRSAPRRGAPCRRRATPRVSTVQSRALPARTAQAAPTRARRRQTASASAPCGPSPPRAPSSGPRPPQDCRAPARCWRAFQGIRPPASGPRACERRRAPAPSGWRLQTGRRASARPHSSSTKCRLCASAITVASAISARPRRVDFQQAPPDVGQLMATGWRYRRCG